MDTRNSVWTTHGLSRAQSLNNPDVISVRPSTTSSFKESAPSASKYPNLNPNLVAVQSKFRRKYYHKIVPAILILIILILMIFVIILAIKWMQVEEVCSSKECIRISSSLLFSMDETTDPCENFYQFTCGNWDSEHPKHDSVTSNDWFSVAQEKILRTIRAFLKKEINETEPEAIAKSKKMFQACMDIKEMDKLNLKPVMKYLKKFKLPNIPTALNITVPTEEASDNIHFDWIISLVKIKKYMGLDIIIGFDIYPDPVNRSLNRIAVGIPETDTVLSFNDDNHIRLRKAKRKLFSSLAEYDTKVKSKEDDSNESSDKEESLSAYISYIRKVVSIIVTYVNPEMKLEDINATTKELTLDAIEMTKDLYKIQEEVENSTKSSNPLDDIVYLTIPKLQNITDQLIYPKTLPVWQKYIQLIMTTNETFNTSDEIIFTSKTDILYLQLLSEYLIDLPEHRVQSYIWLSIVQELVLHTTSTLRALHNDYMKVIIQTEGNPSRSLYCASGVNGLMGMAVSFTLADDNFVKYTLPKVYDMLNYIREAFNDMVRSTSWMDSKTKQATLQKSAAMKSLIGFPEWINNKTILDMYYAEVKISKKRHLENMINILTWQMAIKIREFWNENNFGWATTPSNVNAFHTFQANTITVPIAILQYPFYNLGLEALNYGAIGTVLGHELTHGFDDSGRMYDLNGNMRQWWSNSTISEYVNRTECFVEQYGRYYLADIEEYVNGELTLGENIADNGGLREAFYAYKKYVKKFGREDKLPGLEKYSHEQLFFISFGNLWCETLTPAASRYALEDSHCPGSIRLKGVLSNSEEFTKTFKCQLGSGMYPDENRCKIW